MNETFDAALEALAEAVVFAHEPEAPAMPAEATGDRLALERTAALAAAALVASNPAPARLCERLAAAGLRHCAEQQARQPQPVRADFAAFAHSPRRVGTTGVLLGLAAAALLWLALQAGAAAVPVDRLRGDLLAADRQLLRVDWKGGPSPKSGTVRGDVVWSQTRQEGYLRFSGLPPLDPDHCFQLWIVDSTREGAPVDGGLFAIADAGTETVVPVHAKLPIGKPAAFVVTVESKVGVVVSKQEHVVAIAGL